MSSGSKWSPRYGSQYRRLCARAGLQRARGRDAAVPVDRAPGVARRARRERGAHAGRSLQPPRRRARAAARLGAARRTDASAASAADAGRRRASRSTNGRGASRIARRRKAGIRAPRPNRIELPGLEPEADGAKPSRPRRTAPRSRARRAGAVRRARRRRRGVDDALDAILDARTPLLQRAFRNAQADGPTRERLD